MVPDSLSASQFFERAGANTPPLLFITPILLAVLFMPVIDFLAGLRPRSLRSTRQIDGEGRQADV